MELKGHLLYYPEGKHDINLNNYVQKSQLNDALKSKVDSITKTTYADLKNLRDNSQLVPGSLYRITDYNCTTIQENTRSAGHQFDIVLLALSENKLAEEGWAMMHDNIYDVTFADDVTKKCWIYEDKSSGLVYITDISTMLCINDAATSDVEIDEENKTAICSNYESTELTSENPVYNYFQNSNLSAWKVWYCLDNDTSRFAWAVKSTSVIYNLTINLGGYEVPGTGFRDESRDSGEFKCFVLSIMGNETPGWIKSETISVGTVIVYRQPSEDAATTQLIITSITELPPVKATGVIYRLIDEFNNDIKYDFKNILFKRTITDGEYDSEGNETWCYTLNLWDNNMCQDASIVGNTLRTDTGYIAGVYDNVFGYVVTGVSTPTFVLGNNVVLSINGPFYYGIYSNKIGNSFQNNTIGDKFTNNIIGDIFQGNNIGSTFSSNRIGDDFTNNTIGEEFYYNIIGSKFLSNMLGNDFDYNTIENGFAHNTINNSFSNNMIGNMFESNTLTSYFHMNTIGEEVKFNSIGDNFQNNKIGNSFQNNTIGDSFRANVIGGGFSSNTIGDNFNFNTFGMKVSHITITNNYVRYIRVEDGVEYTDITTSTTPSMGAYLQNIIIGKGIKGTSPLRKTITHPTTNDEKQTTYVPTGSTQIEV